MSNNDKIMANIIVPIIVTIFNKFNININLDCEIAKNMTIDQIITKIHYIHKNLSK